MSGDTNGAKLFDIQSWPHYLKFLLYLVAYMPLVGVVAFLLGQSAGYIPSVFAQHTARAEAAYAEAHTHHLEQRELVARLVVGLRVMCENTSTTRIAYNNCQNIK